MFIRLQVEGLWFKKNNYKEIETGEGNTGIFSIVIPPLSDFKPDKEHSISEEEIIDNTSIYKSYKFVVNPSEANGGTEGVNRSNLYSSYWKFTEAPVDTRSSAASNALDMNWAVTPW